jgi:hypothetical protein
VPPLAFAGGRKQDCFYMSPNGSSKNQGPGRKPNKNGGVKPPQIPGKTAGFWILMIFLVFIVFQMVSMDNTSVQELTFSAFKEQVEAGNIRSLTKTNLDISGELNEKTTLTVKDGSLREVDKFITRMLSEDPDFIKMVEENNENAILIGEAAKTNWWAHILTYYLPFILILLLWVFFIRQMQGGATRPSASASPRPRCSTWTTPRSPSRMWPVVMRPSTSCRRSSTSCAHPRSSSAWAAAFPRACCWWVRRAPARPCWPGHAPAKPACPSSR